MPASRISLLFVIFALFTCDASAQSDRSSWTRDQSGHERALDLFRAGQAINLPTVSMLSRRNLEFEIAHRFFPAIKDGQEVLFGLDGPAAIRFALAFGITDDLSVSVGRSNLDDNVDINIKARLKGIKSNVLPTAFGIQTGLGWNTQVFGLSSTDSRSFQFYLRFIANVMFAKKFGLGIVPSYLENAEVRSVESFHVMRLGVNGQYYLSGSFSVLAEWDPAIDGGESSYNPVSWGLELATGGHFFKLIVTNSTHVNPSQYIAGAHDPAGGKYWRLGFSITRLLKI